MQLLRKCGIIMSEDKVIFNLLIDNGYYISPKETRFGESYEIFKLFEEDVDEEK